MPCMSDSTFLHIENAAHGGAFGNNTIPEPTEAQCIAGNYKVGRANLYGLPLAIEQPRGSYRTGIDAKTGKRWASRMAAHYGYISGTKGADDDAVDCFIGFYPQSETAYVINQNVGGRFDEHKVMLAFPDEDTARRAYLDSYERGWNGLASLVPASISQLKWWLKNGDLRRPLRADNLPHEGLETMTRKVQWNSDALPYDNTLDHVLYEIRCADAGEGLLMDAVTAQEITEDADGLLAFDALVSPYAKLERKMELLRGVMERTGDKVKPVAMQITEPFKQRGVANVAAIFELSDGQTVSIFFHNPDVTPGKMAPTDEVISWKWLLNKKDITIVVAPERGADLNIREVARRIMRLAEKNSPAFQRLNAKRAERMGAIQGLKDEITALEAELATAQHELEVAKVSAEDRAARSGTMIAWKTPLAELGGAEVTAPKYKEGDAVSFNLEPLGSPFFKPGKTTSGTIAKIRTYETESKGAMGGEFKKISYAYDILKTDGKTQDAVEEDYILGSTEGAKVEIPTVDVQNEAKTGGAIEQALIDAYIKAWGDEAAIVNAAVAAVNWEGITDNASATAEIQKLQSAANGERPIIKARDALEAAGMKTWDSRLSGVTETEEFQAQRKAMDACREAMDKIRAIAKEKLIEAGKAELAALPEDAPLEDAARAIYRKHGIDMGQRSDWVSRVVTAVKEKDAEALRSILAGVGSDSNKASMEIFERAAGFKLAKTQKERAKQIDEWAGITTEKRAEIEAAKDAAWQARKLEEGVKDAWGWLKNMNVRDGSDIVDGQQYLLRQFNDGYDEAGTSKKGAATIYGMKKGSGLRFVNNRSFTNFLKAAIAFGGLRQALELVGAVEPKAAEAQGDADKIAAVDAAYPFESATDGFKLWLHESLNEADYSPFVTAKAMDEAVKRHGATVEWGKALAALDDVGHAVASLEASLAVVENNAPINRAEGDILQADLETDTAKSIREAIATLTEADYAPSEEDIGGTFEAEAVTLDSTNEPPVKALLASLRSFLGQQAALDAVPSLDGTEHVGTIKLAGEVIGRIDIADDGKAMVYVGATGDARVVFPSGTRAMYSDDDAVLMVDALFSMRDAAAPAPAAKSTGTEYRYALVYRPAGMGATPAEGFLRVDPAPADIASVARHGVAVYSRELTEQELKQFELRRVHTEADRAAAAEAIAQHFAGHKYADNYYEYVKEGDMAMLEEAMRQELWKQYPFDAFPDAEAMPKESGARFAVLMQEKAVQSDGRITVDGYTYEMDTADGFMVTFVAPETVRGLKLWASEEDAINAKIQDAINLAKSSPYLTKRWNSKRGEVTHVALSHMPTMGAGSETYDVVYSDGSVMRIKGGDFDKTMQKEAYEATPEGAAAIAAERAQRDAAAAEAQSRREAAEKAAAARKQDLDSQIDDWLSKTSYTPVQKGSARAILSREAIYPEFDNAQLARVEFVQRVVDKGGKPNVEQVNRIKDKTRTQWNRMSNEEQREHERKVREGGKVPEYSLGNYIVTKTEYDYANYLLGKKTAQQEPAVSANPERAKAVQYLQGIVSGTTDPLTVDFDNLETLHASYGSDPEVAALFEKAADVVANAALAATA